jgi:hypothetical protein
MSALQRFENRKTINAFFRQLQQPLIHALIENDWPYWLMSEQLPVEPRLFDLPNHVTYEDKTTYHKNNKLSEEGKAFENWCQKFSRECSRVTFKPAPDGMAYPMLISVRNANTLREARGSSKGNRKYIHHGIKSLLHFMEANPSVKAEETIILTPYLKQCSLWMEALQQHEKLMGIRVDTPESMQGWEGLYCWWDMVVCVERTRGVLVAGRHERTLRVDDTTSKGSRSHQ